MSALIAASAMSAQARINYPDTRRVDTVDTYFGTQVADPYRWLEDDRSVETEAWVTLFWALTHASVSALRSSSSQR